MLRRFSTFSLFVFSSSLFFLRGGPLIFFRAEQIKFWSFKLKLWRKNMTLRWSKQTKSNYSWSNLTLSLFFVKRSCNSFENISYSNGNSSMAFQKSLKLLCLQILWFVHFSQLHYTKSTKWAIVPIWMLLSRWIHADHVNFGFLSGPSMFTQSCVFFSLRLCLCMHSLSITIVFLFEIIISNFYWKIYYIECVDLEVDCVCNLGFSRVIL